MKKLLLTALLLTSCNDLHLNPINDSSPIKGIELLKKRNPKKRTVQDYIALSAESFEVNPQLISAIITVESSWRPKVISHAGAMGYMQVMPFNAKRCDLLSPQELLHPEKNIDCGTQIISEELERFDGDLVKALQVYNGGDKCINRCTESINYSRKVLKVLALQS